MGALLGPGRKDESGDFTKGAELDRASIVTLTSIFEPVDDPSEKIAQLDIRLRDSQVGQEGRAEIEVMWSLFAAAGYDDRIRIDPSVVRGLEYYTGPVFEAELTTPIKDERGVPIRLGSVVSGGRYDGLVERFTGEKVPATGLSIGVSRLLYGLKTLGKLPAESVQGPVVVLVLDRDRIADYQKMAQALRNAGIRAELYLGKSGMKAQMKYADKRGSPCVVIQGGDEKATRRGADQGPDPRRHAHLDQGPRRISEEAGRGPVRRARSRYGQGRAGRPRPSQGVSHGRGIGAKIRGARSPSRHLARNVSQRWLRAGCAFDHPAR